MEKEGIVRSTSNAAERSSKMRREKCPKDLITEICRVAFPWAVSVLMGARSMTQLVEEQMDSLLGKDGRVTTSVPPKTLH